VFKAHRLVYHSTLGWRVIKKKKKIFPGWHAGFEEQNRQLPSGQQPGLNHLVGRKIAMQT